MYFSRVRVRPDVRDIHLLIKGNGYGAHQMLWKLFPSLGDGRTFIFREEIGREQIPFHKGVKGEPIFYLVSESHPISDHPVFSVESKPYAPKLARGDRLAFRLRANPTIARKIEGKKNSVRHDVVMDAQYHLLRELADKVGTLSKAKKSVIKQQLLRSFEALSSANIIEERLREIIAENERFKEIVNKSVSLEKLLDVAIKARTNKALEVWLGEKGERLGYTIVRDDPRKRLKFQAEGYQWHPLPQKGKTAGFSSVDFEGEIEVVNSERLTETLFSGIGPAKGFGCGLMLVRRV